MLELRRAMVLEAGPSDVPMQRLEIELAGEHRLAMADVRMVGAAQAGDEVIVNVEARDLALGSGGFDVVHVNLTRGLDGEGVAGAHVMKLNYSSLQHAVAPVEESHEVQALGASPRPVGVFFLHGQLPPLAWAFAQRAPGTRVGYVQTIGGALPGGLSDVVRDLRERGLLAGHLTAGPAYGGEAEAITTAGAIQYGIEHEGWDAVLCGPGPGILGSASKLGHGGMTALDTVHVARALELPAVVVPRMSSGDPRERHRGVSHHAQTVLDLLLVPAIVALPDDGEDWPVGRHEARRVSVDLDGYRASGLPTRTMGRDASEDPLFFSSALAGGGVLAGMVGAT